MTRIQHRRGTTAEWTAADPVLAAGELGFETDTGRHKIGEGTARWSTLPYFLAENALSTWAEDQDRLLARVAPIRVSRRADRVLTNTAVGFVDWNNIGRIEQTTERKAGAGSVAIITPDGSADMAIALREFDPVDMSSQHLKIWLRVSSWGDLGRAQIRVHSTYNDFFYLNVGDRLARPARVDGEWVELVLPRSAFDSRQGSPAWGSVTCLALTAWSPVGTSVTVLANEAVLIPDAAAGVVTLSFDDGWASQFRAAQIMDEHGWPGTAYVIENRIGTDGYLTAAQVDDLHDRGWDIGGHDSVPLRGLTDEQLLDRVSRSAQWLRQRNYRGRQHYAYPNGSVDDRVVGVVRRYFATGRTIDPMNQSLSWVQEHRLAGVSVYAEQDDAEVRGLVDAAVANGEWANIVFHKIGDEGDDISWTEARFRAFLEYVAGSGATVQPVGAVL
ncbi:hyaluronate lyase N-terminal domain-containing protein [Nocardioides pantholopis]|uniref:hyaluronate lyase N-terminal domain-containing protein n=1 Tax=Nocardioides pantholopis TaxID=2483798 RepID=UPI000F089D59|nr:polysaccharide deacetylase family protein [Nocardioides pantholopis]